MTVWLKRFNKFWVALTAAAGVILAANLLPEDQAKLISTILAAIGAALVYLVPNVDDTEPLSPAPKQEPVQDVKDDGDPGDVPGENEIPAEEQVG